MMNLPRSKSLPLSLSQWSPVGKTVEVEISTKGVKDDLLLFSEERVEKATSDELIELSLPLLATGLQLTIEKLKVKPFVLLSELEFLKATNSLSQT